MLAFRNVRDVAVLNRDVKGVMSKRVDLFARKVAFKKGAAFF